LVALGLVNRNRFLFPSANASYAFIGAFSICFLPDDEKALG
jgi:hypothetical protein